MGYTPYSLSFPRWYCFCPFPIPLYNRLSHRFVLALKVKCHATDCVFVSFQRFMNNGGLQLLTQQQYLAAQQQGQLPAGLPGPGFGLPYIPNGQEQYFIAGE
ncbi:hypothetical protein FJT64_013630 [Amphibalanus amphitrite]|uniref:Uncharacterized protein n=1 Tax=Amphibalanus amphitrite TaxID=1232801 RepID=A0A6A4UZQ5_AMPAM|nr:hypothetical protein FJT64_013630 [Amphibalanus amphitrite]